MLTPPSRPMTTGQNHPARRRTRAGGAGGGIGGGVEGNAGGCTVRTSVGTAVGATVEILVAAGPRPGAGSATATSEDDRGGTARRGQATARHASRAAASARAISPAVA